MAGVDALLDLDDPGLSSSVHYVGGGGNGLVSGGGHGDIFDTGAFDDFNTESTSYKSSSSQLYHDDFDPFSAPNANTDLYRLKVEHEPQLLPSAVVATETNGGEPRDQFADLLGDFGTGAVDEPCDDQLNNPKRSDDDDQQAVDNDTSFYDGQLHSQHRNQRTENMTSNVIERMNSVVADNCCCNCSLECGDNNFQRNASNGNRHPSKEFDAGNRHIFDDTYDILCAFPEQVAPHAEIEDTTIGDDDDWPQNEKTLSRPIEIDSNAETGKGRRRKSSTGHVTRFDLSATTVRLLTPSPSDDELMRPPPPPTLAAEEVDVDDRCCLCRRRNVHLCQHRGTWPITYIDGDDEDACRAGFRDVELKPADGGEIRSIDDEDDDVYGTKLTRFHDPVSYSPSSSSSTDWKQRYIIKTDAYRRPHYSDDNDAIQRVPMTSEFFDRVDCGDIGYMYDDGDEAEMSFDENQSGQYFRSTAQSDCIPIETCFQNDESARENIDGDHQRASTMDYEDGTLRSAFIVVSNSSRGSSVSIDEEATGYSKYSKFDSACIESDFDVVDKTMNVGRNLLAELEEMDQVEVCPSGFGKSGVSSIDSDMTAEYRDDDDDDELDAGDNEPASARYAGTEVELINNNTDHQRYTANGNLDADVEPNNGFQTPKTSTFTWTQAEAPGDKRRSDPIEVVDRYQRDQLEVTSDDRSYQRKFTEVEPEVTGRGLEGPSETKKASVGRTGSTSIRRNQSRERRQQELSSRTPQDENACHQCGKRVYQMERITADEMVYHKTCFRCSHCNRVLSLLNYSAIDGQMYCKPHFLEMFKTKGNYEDGFRAAGSRPSENGVALSPENEQYHAVVATTNSHNNTSAEWRDSHADGAADNRPQEEIPAVPIKQVRNIFENLVQQSGSQQVMPPPQPSRPVRERSVERGWTSVEQQATVSKSRSSDAVVPDGGVSADREVVQCSSTTCIIEDELPPPAMTRSILAKFRELESSVGDGKPAVPLPVTRSASMSLSSRNAARPVRYDVVRSSTSSSLGHSDDNRTVRGAGSNDDVDYAGTNGLSDVKSGLEADELPQQGTARSLLARWRTIEESSRDEREETTRKSSPAKRSQSTSRVEGRQRPRVIRRNNSDDEDGEERVADYLDVQNTSDYQGLITDDERPPHLMTQQVLAKFRSMESESRVAAERELPRLQRSRSFRWEVKEAVPLSRGNIMVHGDLPKRSISQYDGFSQDMTSDNEAVPAASSFREDELPAPATTRNLLSLFKSMEDPAAAPPTPATVERNLSLARSESRSRSYHHSVGSRPTSEFDADYQATGSRLNEDGYDAVAPDAGEFENEPVFDPNLVRESDRNDVAEFPERGTTRGLLAKFRSMQQ